MRRIVWYVLVILLLSGLPAGPAKAQEDPACPGAPTPRLVVGGFGQVAPGDPNNLRDQPARAGELVGSVSGG
ncbi:MAG: hypothetical protein JW910_23195, partial [Anaerolineae bacterium]|nr:hypothetical protein [Anaerolineae bacterium]